MEVQIKQEVDEFESVVVKEEFCVDGIIVPELLNENSDVAIKSENPDELANNDNPEQFVQFEITEIHEPHASEKVAETIRCLICKHTFRSKHDRGKHMITDHGRQYYYCAHCPTKFVFKWSLRVHLLHHTRKAKVRCFVCKKNVPTISALYRHVQKHYNGKCYKCSICKKRYYDSTYLVNHIHNVHTVRSERNLELHYKCDICHMKIITAKLLKRHKLIEHGEKSSFKCPYCERNFAREATIESHISVDHRGLPVDPSIDPLACTVCKEEFGDLDTLRKHVMVHSIETSYKCQICQKKYLTAGAIKQHVMLDHKRTKFPDNFPDGWKEYKCSRTGKIFPAILQKRVKCLTTYRDKLYKCEYCSRLFTSKGRFEQHIMAHERNLSLFLCRICGKAYPIRKNRNVHEKTEHSKGEFQIQDQPDLPGTAMIVRMDNEVVKEECLSEEEKETDHHNENGQETIKSEKIDEVTKSEEAEDFVYYDIIDDEEPQVKVYRCSLCDQSFDTVEKKEEHELNHNIAPFVCAHCPTMFQFKWSLQLHLLNHMEAPVLECFVCGVTFEQYNNLLSHVKKHFKCIICGEQFSEIDHLKNHEEDAHTSTSYCKKERVTCTVCNASFHKLGNLKRHNMMFHHKCPYCDNQFAKKSNIELHITRHHRGLPLDCSQFPPTCTVCKAAYGSLEALKKHVKVHVIEKGFECGFCKEKFSTDESIHNHVEKDHKGEKLPMDFPNSWGLFTCHNSGKTFSAIRYYRNNKFMHKCSICHQGFPFKYELSNHILCHKEDDNTGTRFPCRICAKNFLSEEDVSNHEKEHAYDNKVNSLFLLLKKAKDAATASKSGGPSRTTSSL